jgi:glutathione S-transferase
VICEYLEDRHPDPAVYPREPVDRARARWLEEFADTRMGEVIIWRLFNQVAINPRVFGVPTDEKVLNHAREVEIPHVLDYLESQLPVSGFLFGAIGIADIAIAAFFRNAAFSRYRVDAERWPRTAAFVDRAHGHDCFSKLVPFEKASMSVPPPQQRAALEAAGAPLSAADARHRRAAAPRHHVDLSPCRTSPSSSREPTAGSASRCASGSPRRARRARARARAVGARGGCCARCPSPCGPRWRSSTIATPARSSSTRAGCDAAVHLVGILKETAQQPLSRRARAAVRGARSGRGPRRAAPSRRALDPRRRSSLAERVPRVARARRRDPLAREDAAG